MRKEVAVVRKKIDMASKDLKPLGQNCQKKVIFQTTLSFNMFLGVLSQIIY